MRAQESNSEDLGTAWLGVASWLVLALPLPEDGGVLINPKFDLEGGTGGAPFVALILF